MQSLVTNIGSMFEENYNLAFTQQRKNKDIPEGGSKGVILLNLAHQVRFLRNCVTAIVVVRSRGSDVLS